MDEVKGRGRLVGIQSNFALNQPFLSRVQYHVWPQTHIWHYKTPTIQQSAHNIQFGTKHDKGI